MTDPDYFTLAEFRALPGMESAVKFTDDRINAVAADITARIEREVETSFVARTVTAEVHDGGTYAIALGKPYVVSITSATENGATVTDTLKFKDGLLRGYPSGSYTPRYWLAGLENVAVTYEAGYSSTPPLDIKEATMQATRASLLASSSNASLDARRTTISTDHGTVQLSVAGKGRPTGYPEIDAIIGGWRDNIRPTPAG